MQAPPLHLDSQQAQSAEQAVLTKSDNVLSIFDEVRVEDEGADTPTIPSMHQVIPPPKLPQQDITPKRKRTQLLSPSRFMKRRIPITVATVNTTPVRQPLHLRPQLAQLRVRTRLSTSQADVALDKILTRPRAKPSARQVWLGASHHRHGLHSRNQKSPRSMESECAKSGT